MNLIFLPFQIILLAFLLFAFSRVMLRFREGSLSLGAFLFWSTVWILASIMVIRPQLTTLVANKLGIGRGADAIIYLSLVLLFYLIYRTNVYLENIRHEITELTRKIALSDSKPHSKEKIANKGK